MEARKYVSVTEMASAMQVPPRTVRDWCSKGVLPSKQIAAGGKRLIPVAQLAEANEWAAVAVARRDIEGW